MHKRSTLHRVLRLCRDIVDIFRLAFGDREAVFRRESHERYERAQAAFRKGGRDA